MSDDDGRVSRRLRGGLVLAAVLVLATGSAAAHAVWRNSVALTAGPVASGSFDLSTQWVGDWSRWVPLFPGTSSETATLRVTETGAAGTTLRWRLSATAVLSADVAPYATTQLFVGSCATGTPLASGVPYPSSGGFAPGESVDLCLRVTLSASAPQSLEAKAATPSIAVTADQALS